MLMSIPQQRYMSIPGSGLQPVGWRQPNCYCWGPGNSLSRSRLFCSFVCAVASFLQGYFCLLLPASSCWGLEVLPSHTCELLSSHPHPLFDSVTMFGSQYTATPVDTDELQLTETSIMSLLMQGIARTFPHPPPAISWGSAAAGAHALPGAVLLSSASAYTSIALHALLLFVRVVFLFFFLMND